MNPAWHTFTLEEAFARLGVQPEAGLSHREARDRLARVGPNRLREEERESIWESILEELREPLILLLVGTGVLYALWGEVGDALTILFVIFALMAVELVNERRSGRAIAALSKLAEPVAWVRREGAVREISAEEIVPGDVLILQAGRIVPADARLVEAFGMAADESSLTGESVPVDKDSRAEIPVAAPLAERANLVYAGTTITRGRGTAVVVATGMETELGRVAGMAREEKSPPTPLQVSMRELTRWLVWLALGLSVVVPVLGVILGGQPLRTMLLTGLSLAFATIPEEGPIIITMVLALGAYRLAKNKALVRELRAVETLGAVTVIATDKTGTLTENRMEVARLAPETHRRRLLEIGALCNSTDTENASGDPLEAALLRAAAGEAIDVAALRKSRPLVVEFPFDNLRKRMSVVCSGTHGNWVGVKGAPEAVLEVSEKRWTGRGSLSLNTDQRRDILKLTEAMAAEGMRVIALAEKELPANAKLTQEKSESQLTYVGLAGLADPPRGEVREAIASCRSAGIRIKMITGDHPLTAQSIAHQVGLEDGGHVMTGAEIDALSDAALRLATVQVSVFARTTPEHKLRIVKALRELGERVAATGDGTNDAPALVAADIGVAMGETGTDVARASADIVLADDNFTTIVRAVEEGRKVFANLKKALRYYLACKVALASSTLLPVLLRAPVPFAPVQIILTELFMDLAASTTFVAERPESDLMRRPPRDPQAPFMDQSMVAGILTSSTGLFAAVSAAYLFSWYSTSDLVKSQTIAFVTWLLGHVFLAFNMRSENEPLVHLGLFSNRWMVLWGAVALAFALAVALFPAAQSIFKTSSLSVAEWLGAAAAALVGTFWMEGRKRFRWQESHRS